MKIRNKKFIYLISPNKIINNLDKGNILNNDYANIIIEIFSILKSYNLNELLNIECNLLLDYLNASIYYWILENNYNNIVPNNNCNEDDDEFSIC